MQTQKIIEQFGYKPNEAKVYLSALTLGEATISEIAHHANLPRTSVQYITNKLHLDGLMNFYTKKRYTYWIAEKPEKFLMQLKEKEVAFESIVSKLNTIQHTEDKKPSVKVFYDVAEIKLIFQDIFDTKHNILAMLSWDNLIEVLGEEYVDDLTELRIKHFLKMRLLTPKTKETIKLKKYDALELRYTSFLPERCSVADSILIYGSKVALISLNKKHPTGFLIDDQHMVDTMTSVFEEMWDQNTA